MTFKQTIVLASCPNLTVSSLSTTYGLTPPFPTINTLLNYNIFFPILTSIEICTACRTGMHNLLHAADWGFITVLACLFTTRRLYRRPETLFKPKGSLEHLQALISGRIKKIEL